MLRGARADSASASVLNDRPTEPNLFCSGREPIYARSGRSAETRHSLDPRDLSRAVTTVFAPQQPPTIDFIDGALSSHGRPDLPPFGFGSLMTFLGSGPRQKGSASAKPAVTAPGSVWISQPERASRRVRAPLLRRALQPSCANIPLPLHSSCR